MYSYRYFSILIYAVIFICSLSIFQNQLSHPVAEDSGHLLPVKIKAVQSGEGEKELQDTVKEAARENEQISIAGMQHSQGGHTLYPDGILLDMKPYDDILALDKKEKLITVQSGVTWADIQSYINPHGLALKVSQSQNIFTVGGSLSVNAHGLDVRHHALIDTVESFRLLTAEGEILHVSREENEELFPLVIGGYGLFGVILDVTLELTDDELYQIHTETMSYQEYPDYFKENVLQNKKVNMHRARISVAPESFLTEMYVMDYVYANDQSRLEQHQQLKREKIIALPKFFLGLSRVNDWGKNMFWRAQEEYIDRKDGAYISRNNAMRSDSEFMEYTHARKTEVLQEYFVPVDHFPGYIDDLRKLLQQEPEFNLLNITVRYVEENEEAVLSYAKEDMFALVLLINQGTSKESMEENGRVIRKMIELTLDYQGSYYLPYYSYPTRKQLEEAYPKTEDFFQLKEKYDPEGRFKNLFYEEYRR